MTAMGRVLPTADVGYASAQLGGVSFLAVRSSTVLALVDRK